MNPSPNKVAGYRLVYTASIMFSSALLWYTQNQNQILGKETNYGMLVTDNVTILLEIFNILALSALLNTKSTKTDLLVLVPNGIGFVLAVFAYIVNVQHTSLSLDFSTLVWTSYLWLRGLGSVLSAARLVAHRFGYPITK
jgi:hypothetical protein